MDTHHVHHTDVHFHGGTDKVLDLYRTRESRHEFERHKEEAERHGEASFTIGGTKYKMLHEKGDGPDDKGRYSVKLAHSH